jgi:hypothetical protein
LGVTFIVERGQAWEPAIAEYCEDCKVVKPLTKKLLGVAYLFQQLVLFYTFRVLGHAVTMLFLTMHELLDFKYQPIRSYSLIVVNGLILYLSFVLLGHILKFIRGRGATT